MRPHDRSSEQVAEREARRPGQPALVGAFRKIVADHAARQGRRQPAHGEHRHGIEGHDRRRAGIIARIGATARSSRRSPSQRLFSSMTSGTRPSTRSSSSSSVGMPASLSCRRTARSSASVRGRPVRWPRSGGRACRHGRPRRGRRRSAAGRIRWQTYGRSPLPPPAACSRCAAARGRGSPGARSAAPSTSRVRTSVYPVRRPRRWLRPRRRRRAAGSPRRRPSGHAGRVRRALR